MTVNGFVSPGHAPPEPSTGFGEDRTGEPRVPLSAPLENRLVSVFPTAARRAETLRFPAVEPRKRARTVREIHAIVTGCAVRKDPLNSRNDLDGGAGPHRETARVAPGTALSDDDKGAEETPKTPRDAERRRKRRRSVTAVL